MQLLFNFRLFNVPAKYASSIYLLNLMAGTYQWHQDLESGWIAIPELHSGSFPNVILSQRDLHRNLQHNIERLTLGSGSWRPSNTPRSFPITSPG